MPKELTRAHQIESNRFNAKQLNDREANFFYRLEDYYINPLFAMSSVVQKETNLLFANKDEKSYLKAIESLYYELSSRYDIPAAFKFNNIKKNYKSYYNPSKKTVFFNKGYALRLFNKERLKKYSGHKIIAIILHELTHAFIDTRWNYDGIHVHDHVFYHFFIKLLSDFSGINAKKFKFKPIDDDDHGLKLPLVNELKGKDVLFLSNNKEIYRFGTFDDFESASKAMSSAFDMSFDNKYFNSIIPFVVEQYNKSTKKIDQIFPDLRFHVYKQHGKVAVDVYKELKYQLRHHDNYKYYLKTKYKRLLEQ